MSGKAEQYANAFAGTQLSLKLLQLLLLVKARIERRHCPRDRSLLHLPSLHHCVSASSDVEYCSLPRNAHHIALLAIELCCQL